jgi:cytochrome c5
LLCACVPRWFVETPVAERQGGVSPERGRDLLLNKSFLKVGVPFGTEKALFHPKLEPSDKPSKLSGRSRVNAFLPTGYTGRVLGEGVNVATENCLLCHAGALRGEWVLGLGNSFLDAMVPETIALVDQRKVDDLSLSQAQRDVLEDWKRYQLGLLPYSRSTSPGTIAALYFTGYLFSHRDPSTLAWTEQAAFPMLKTPPPETDIPAWWLLKRKRCLYYGCELKGDFTRSLMQFMTVPGNSGDDIRAAERDFEDVLAFLFTLTPPKFPGPVDGALAARGEAVFEKTCSDCHGHYGASPAYPNKVIPLEKVGTDPARNAFMHELPFAEHYGKSWYGEHSKLEATNGYLAPPLDGVWATAPYLHNASVPTLDAVLDPRLRPKLFLRSRDSRDYDLERVGWKYEVVAAPGPDVFDTTLYGKGNEGHRFAEPLSDEERHAVLEYLKTL